MGCVLVRTSFYCPSGGCLTLLLYASELLFHFYFGEGFDDVAYLYVVEVDEAYTALEVYAYFLDVVLEAL